VRQRGLADAGHVLDEQVAAREDARHREADLAFLAEDHLACRATTSSVGPAASRLRARSASVWARREKRNSVSGLRVDSLCEDDYMGTAPR
jgi:hypothetical protein